MRIKSVLAQSALGLAGSPAAAKSPRGPSGGGNLEGRLRFRGRTAFDSSSPLSAQEGMIRVENPSGCLPGEKRRYGYRLRPGHAGDGNRSVRIESEEFLRTVAAALPKPAPSSGRLSGAWNDSQILRDGTAVAIRDNGRLRNRLTNGSNDGRRTVLVEELRRILTCDIKIGPLRHRVLTRRRRGRENGA